MTEPEWLTSTDPAAMLKLLKDSKAFNNPEGWASDRKLRLFACVCCWRHSVELGKDAEQCVQWHTGPAKNPQSWAMAWAGDQKRPSTLYRAALLREIIGNPYRQPVYDRCCGLRNHGAVIRIASTIYEGRRWEDMPILADALEDAWCEDTDILSHLRGPGPHVRGCWVIDLLLGNS